jgi:hypothetical protein
VGKSFYFGPATGLKMVHGFCGKVVLARSVVGKAQGGNGVKDLALWILDCMTNWQ